ncbi:MAG: alpha-amylase, partial [Akkermansiaceae bacterium]
MSTSSLPQVCLFFEAHQPNRLKTYSFFDIGNDPFYENDDLNREILDKVSERCYLPANKLLTDLIEKHSGSFKVSLSISGVLIEQMEIHRPDVLESFKKLHATGGVEILAETYYHSMGFHHNPAEFERQVKRQEAVVEKHFGVKPTTFRHTELIYFNELAAYVEGMGYKGMLAEGVPALLGHRSPNYLYRSPNVKNMPVLLRHGGLSDDCTFRFSDQNWN